MRSIIRMARDLFRVARSGDPQALDRAVHGMARNNPNPTEVVARGFTKPVELLYLGIAWRDRARLITGDVADLDRAVHTLDRVADGWPLAQAELALALWLRSAVTGRADGVRALETARAAVASAPGQDRPREVLEYVEARATEPVDGMDRTGPVTGEDGRVAVVWTGRHGNTVRHLVMISDQAEVVDAVTFAEIWAECRWDVEVLLVVDRGGDERQLLPYRRSADLGTLAADALTSIRIPVTVRGPYRVPGSAARSFVFAGHLAGQDRRVALVTVDPDPPDADLARHLFHVELCTTELTDFHWIAAAPAPVGDRRSAPALMRQGPATLTVAEFGEAVLRFATHYEHAGLTCVWLRPVEGGYAYGIRRDEDEPITIMVATTSAWPPPDEQIKAEAETWDQLRAFHAETYRQATRDALMAAGEDDELLLTAFEKFTFHLRFLDADAEGATDAAVATVHDGLMLVDALNTAHLTYAAEWVAASCARIAARLGMHDEQRSLLRHAAIACEVTGLFDAALAHYQEALDVEGPSADAWLTRNLHISYATTCVSLFTTHELEVEPPDERLVTGALAHLDIAEAMVRAAPEEETAWARLAVPAHRWRLRDLLGEHETAADELDRLARDPAMADHLPLRGSTVLFRLAALRKLADPDRYDAAIEQAAAEEGLRFTDRRVVFDTFLADWLIDQGDLTAAFLAAEEAHELQLWHDTRIARTPRPGEPHGGHRTIDTLARMCRAWWLLERSGELEEQHLLMLFRALRWRVETAKSRWLNRDLTQGTSGPADLDERLGIWGDRMRVELGAGAARYLDSDQPERLTTLSRDEPVAALRRRLPESSVLMSFYETRDFTLVSCVTPERGVYLSLPVTRRELETAVRYLQAGFSGAGIYAPIDPERPFDLPDHFLARFRELGRLFTPVIPVVRDSPFILIAPHGAWHNVPVHALLLPQLWDSGRNPALSYVPSLDTATVLFERAEGRAAPTRAAVAAHPLADVERTLFHESHQQVVGALRAVMPEVDTLFGRDVTPDEVMSMADRSDLLHVLAHGATPADPKAIMNAGLALSPGSGADGLLTANSLLRARLDGTHLTFQACSVGRVVTAASDEMWGLVRSALLARAGSVLAPMWNADLRSSTRLLDRFYASWLADGKTKAQAFTEAQRDMYRKSDVDAWRHMYHWAAFKLMGA